MEESWAEEALGLGGFGTCGYLFDLFRWEDGFVTYGHLFDLFRWRDGFGTYGYLFDQSREMNCSSDPLVP